MSDRQTGTCCCHRHRRRRRRRHTLKFLSTANSCCIQHAGSGMLARLLWHLSLHCSFMARQNWCLTVFRARFWPHLEPVGRRCLLSAEFDFDFHVDVDFLMPILMLICLLAISLALDRLNSFKYNCVAWHLTGFLATLWHLSLCRSNFPLDFCGNFLCFSQAFNSNKLEMSAIACVFFRFYSQKYHI